jgi:hypothetical protein
MYLNFSPVPHTVAERRIAERRAILGRDKAWLAAWKKKRLAELDEWIEFPELPDDELSNN